jgi:predicted ATPase/signal transduction histidine kinase/serine/threonine protein kinase
LRPDAIEEHAQVDLAPPHDLSDFRELDMLGYTVLDPLQQGATTVLYRGIRDSDGCPVILKTARAARPSPRDLERLHHEYEMSRALRDLPAVVKVHAFETPHGAAPVLVLEDFGGQTLETLIGPTLPIERFLQLAVRLADALSAIHARNVIHRDLNPRNILWNAESGDLKVTDFGIASYAEDELASIEAPALIEGTPAYMSPEQTGRMNRRVGPEADLYSMGITLYEMLTGILPFSATDIAEWVHVHVARSAVPPAGVRPDVPAPLSGIVMRLIAKVPEERYPSATALARDLEICAKQWDSTRRIEPFDLARHDVSERFRIPATLYGRAPVVVELLSSFDEVARSGAPRCALVSGAPGVGKSALLSELQGAVASRGGGLACARFDPYARDKPYATLALAFGELVRRVLTQRDERIHAFREELEGAAGANAPLLATLLPHLELILGKAAPLGDLPSRDARNRFHLAFRKFVGLFAKEGHPLALLLDDLQWADDASLELVEQLLGHPEVRHLWVLGAHRSTETSPSRSLVAALERMRKLEMPPHEAVLADLPPEEVRAMIADTLRVRPETAAPLAEVVQAKTAGNPLFVIQFLKKLHQDLLVYFDPQRHVWQWDLDRIRARGYADNVVDLMVGKLAELRPRAREAATWASCLGTEVDPALIALVLGRSQAEIESELSETVSAGLMDRRGGGYVFLHERIRQAAYSLIPSEERPHVHLRIGRALAAFTPLDSAGEKLFEVAAHLTMGLELVEAAEERERLARLFLFAGRKAKSTTAYQSAAAFFASGRLILGDGGWHASDDLAFALHLESAECAWLIGDITGSQRLLDGLRHRTRTRESELAVLEVTVRLHTVAGRTEEAVEHSLAALRLLGVDWPLHPPLEMVERALENVFQLLGERRIEDLLELPRMAHAESKELVRIAAALSAFAGYVDPHLHALVASFIVSTSLTHGNDDNSPIGYALFGQYIVQAFGRYDEGYRFATLARDLIERYDIAAHRAKIRFVLGATLTPWVRPYRSALDDLETAFRAGLESGDLLWTAYACGPIVALLLIAGEPLETVEREADKMLRFAGAMRFDDEIAFLVSARQCVRQLRGLTKDFSTFRDDRFDEASFEDALEQKRIPTVRCIYEILKTKACVLSGDLARAVAGVRRAKELLWAMPSFFMGPEHYFWGALALAAHWQEVVPEERAEYASMLEEHRRKLEEWSKNCPANFGCKHALVSAEVARVHGRLLEAEQGYEEAIRLAREGGFVQLEAVAYEWAARFYRTRGFALFADTYVREARSAYARWGAEGKQRQLDQTYPEVRAREPLSFVSTIAVSPEALEGASIVRASQSISREIETPRLIQTLLRLALLHAGADRVALILETGSRLSIEAEVRGDDRDGGAPLPMPIGDSSELPLSVLLYVRRTHEKVLLDDAARESIFSSDTYVTKERPRSVLCLPIVRQSRLTGMLYFENRLAPGAFNADRITVLELLAGQIAISLDNTRLYEQLKRERDLLTRIMDTSPVGIVVAERDGEISFANTKAIEMLDLYPSGSPQRMRRVSDWQVTDADGNPLSQAEQPLHRAMSAHEPVYGARMAVETRAGRRLLSVNAARSFDHAGDTGPARVVATFEDVTAQLEAARERTMMQERLIVSDRLQSMGVLAAGIAHEINNPLTYVLSNLNLLELDIDDLEAHATSPARREGLERLRERLRDAEEGSGRIRAIVRDVMSFARVDEARRGPVDLRRVIELAANMAAVEIRSRARLVTDLGEAPLVDGSESRLSQVLLNLLINAAQAISGSNPDDNEIRIVTRTDEAGRAVLEVRDTGAGISPAIRSHIFDPFFTTKPVGVGTGLGLAICYSIVTGMGGEIEVESEPGAGSVFRILLWPHGHRSTQKAGRARP